MLTQVCATVPNRRVVQLTTLRNSLIHTDKTCDSGEAEDRSRRLICRADLQACGRKTRSGRSSLFSPTASNASLRAPRKRDIIIQWPNGGNVFIGEGYATCARVHEATGDFVYVAFDSGNLKSVAINIRKKFPDARLILLADNDRFTTKPVNDPGLNPPKVEPILIGATDEGVFGAYTDKGDLGRTGFNVEPMIFAI